MLLGFKRRFAPFVEDGSKTHTIRALRKPSKFGYAVRSPRVGEMCHCYVDPRQKTMRLLGRWPCVKIERITIASNTPYSRYGIWINGNVLTEDERNLLAWRDGFRTCGHQEHAFEEMMEFWEGRLPFTGDIIHWKKF